MSTYHFEVDGTRYSGETASAKNQFQAFHLAANSKLILGIKDDVSEQFMVVCLMSMSWSDLQALEDLLVKDSVTRELDGVPVGQNMFRDDPAKYALLIARVAKANLSGFFTLSGENKSAEAGQDQATQ